MLHKWNVCLSVAEIVHRLSTCLRRIQLDSTSVPLRTSQRARRSLSHSAMTTASGMLSVTSVKVATGCWKFMKKMWCRKILWEWVWKKVVESRSEVCEFFWTSMVATLSNVFDLIDSVLKINLMLHLCVRVFPLSDAVKCRNCSIITRTGNSWQLFYSQCLRN